MLGTYRLVNQVTKEGLLHFFTMWGKEASALAAEEVSIWDLGLIGDAGFTGLSVLDTITSHPGWTEVGGRATWATTNVPVAQKIVAAQPTELSSEPGSPIFTFSGPLSLRGLLVTTRDAPPEIVRLLATALFDSVINVNASSSLEVSYNFKISSGVVSP